MNTCTSTGSLPLARPAAAASRRAGRAAAAAAVRATSPSVAALPAPRHRSTTPGWPLSTSLSSSSFHGAARRGDGSAQPRARGASLFTLHMGPIPCSQQYEHCTLWTLQPGS